MGQKRPHAIEIVLIIQWLSALFGGDHVQCQLPIDVAPEDNTANEPEPDAAFFAQPVTVCTDRHPGPNDSLLVIDASDTTPRFDLTAKATLYAHAGIRDYWVVDVTGRRIIVHQHPTAESYQSITAYAEGETLAPLAKPDASVRVADQLPPAE